MSTAESAPLAVAHSKDWLSEQMSTLSISELTVAHLTAMDTASFSSSNAPRLSSEWMMTGEAGSPVVAIPLLHLHSECRLRQNRPCE